MTNGHDHTHHHGHAPGMAGAAVAPRPANAYTGHGVIESSLSLPWERRIAARFAFPEGAF